jgi:hypothetical protein
MYLFHTSPLLLLKSPWLVLVPGQETRSDQGQNFDQFQVGDFDLDIDAIKISGLVLNPLTK